MIQGNILVFILVIIIITSLAIAFRRKPNYNKIPRKIWTYWHDSDPVNGLPKTIKMCQESWRKHNPDYEITLLTRKNYFSYVNIPEEIANNPIFNEDPKRFEALVALYTLSEHGGVWIDAATLLKEPLDNWLFPKYGTLAGFYNDNVSQPNKPLIELWFLACNKGSRFLKLWRDEFAQIIRFQNIEQYIQNRKQIGVDFKSHNHIDTVHLLAAYKVLHLDKFPTDSFILKPSSSTYRHLTKTDGDSEKALKLACLDKKYQNPLIHFHPEDLKTLEKQIEYDLSPEVCGWLD